MAWGIQVRVYNRHIEDYEWKWVHPSGARLGDFYKFDTEADARRTCEMCYPLSDKRFVRVQEVPDGADQES